MEKDGRGSFLVHPLIISEKKDDFEVFAQVNLIGEEVEQKGGGGCRDALGRLAG